MNNLPLAAGAALIGAAAFFGRRSALFGGTEHPEWLDSQLQPMRSRIWSALSPRRPNCSAAIDAIGDMVRVGNRAQGRLQPNERMEVAVEIKQWGDAVYAVCERIR